MASDSEKRKLTELRVVDLRSELEKRDLDKNGVKAVLIERLEKILREEGHDPEEYLFDSSEKKTPMKRITKRGEQDTDENHDQSDMDEDTKDESLTDVETKQDVKGEIVPKKEPEETSEGEQIKAEPMETETLVKTPTTNTEDELHVKKESEKSKAVSENTVTAESEKNDGKQTNESEKTDLDEIKSTGKTDSEPSKNSSKSIEKVDGAKPTTDQLTDATNSNIEVDKQKLDIQSSKDADKDAPEANGVDNEDSINLTIGEDDEKLLAEEEESSQEKESKVVKSTEEDAGGQKSQLIDATSQCGSDARNGSLIVPVDEGGVHKKERAGHGQDKQSTTVGEDKVKSQEEEGKASADKSKRFVSHTTVSTFTYTASTPTTLDNTGFVFGEVELSTLQ
uniref:SAP domain-containing protein n=1 Tax=Timema bartmani TaxID=61472 RepID=A0A7R9ENM5_9NEOP|nr:unnamed protein product [Timema bartmani]